MQAHRPLGSEPPPKCAKEICRQDKSPHQYLSGLDGRTFGNFFSQSPLCERNKEEEITQNRSIDIYLLSD